MDVRAVEKADIRLHAMRRALSDMEAVSSPLEFSSDWYVFITAANGIYEVLKKGASSDSAGRAWIKSEIIDPCEADQLLKYMYEARNDEEHGLVKSVRHAQVASGVGIPFGAGDGSVTATIRVDENGVLHVENVISDFANAVGFVVDEYDMVLSTVTSRSGVSYPPPNMHLHIALEDERPVTAATATYAYMENLIARARMYLSAQHQ